MRSGTRAAAGGFAAAVLLVLSGCAGTATPPDTTSRDIQRTLDARAAAVLGRDADAYVAALDGGLRAAGRAEFASLADVPLSSWEYRLSGVRRSGDRATADAELRYRIEGYDSAPVTSARVLELAERDGRWYVTADRAGRGGAEQLWQQGDVEAVRGSRSLVLGVGQDRELLRRIAADADRAVPAVSAAWPGRWAARVVVLVPGTLDAMGRLLGAPAAGYRGIAAVTTGEAGASGAVPADRVIVNPEAYAELGEFGRRIVLTHETTHVATRAATSEATPLWLSEGFADWAAYRGTGRTAAQAAPELARAVRAGSAPSRLPADEDFRFGTDGEALGRAYEGGWLACLLIAERWGTQALTDFYRAAGEYGPAKALHDVLGATPDAFTAAWSAFVRARLG
ncbi:hypothetical protein [Streptomyces formicae]|uniref:Lipoprotein n=1 Tax=Streptomyces formicae TaxID=1616117 RepID=A0ABY3X3Z9_9ACTN|nr:hypothetical protein [Streptomyces formicae]UNM16748.1 hypothetical protein J4032_26975 [Streptomyces formicae]